MNSERGAPVNVTHGNSRHGDRAILIPLARQKLSELRIRLGTWQAVADELAPLHVASKGLWWKVCNGQSSNPQALAALLSHFGLQPYRRPTGKPVWTPEQRARKERLGLTWREEIECGLRSLEGESHER